MILTAFIFVFSGEPFGENVTKPEIHNHGNQQTIIIHQPPPSTKNDSDSDSWWKSLSRFQRIATVLGVTAGLSVTIALASLGAEGILTVHVSPAFAPPTPIPVFAPTPTPVIPAPTPTPVFAPTPTPVIPAPTPTPPCQGWSASIPANIAASIVYTWNQLIANGTSGSPPKRAAHSMVTVGNNFYLFGGQDGQKAYNDLWKFDGSTSTWVQLIANGTAGSPPARDYSAYTSISSSFYLSAGMFRNVATRVFNDLWSFDTNLLSWATVTADGASGSPAPRTGGSMVAIGNNLYMFGGGAVSGSPDLNDLWKYSGGLWSPLIAAGTSGSPSRRGFAGMTTVGSNIYLFDGDTRLSDLWKYNPTANTWSPVSSSGSPSPGRVPAMGSNNQAIFIFGGGPASGDYLNDLWKFDISTSSWTNLIANGQSGSPSKRNSMGTLNQIGDDFYIFGGTQYLDYATDTITNVALNDLWQLRMVSIGLYGMSVSPNPICANIPFNFSWKVNTTRGSSQHTATVTFNGATTTATYFNTLGSIILNTPNSLTNLLISLQVSDKIYPAATTSSTVTLS